MGYKVGDMVVYPRHGAARVEAITERVVKGVKREYLQLTVLSSDGLVINVPVENAQKVGVRDIVESLIGATFLEHGIDEARKVIHRLIDDTLAEVATEGPALDWKTSLTVKAHHLGKAEPVYHMVGFRQ